MFDKVTGALDRNSKAIAIIEWSNQGRQSGQYERIVCQLSLLPHLQVLFSSGGDHSAHLLHHLFARVSDAFQLRVEWLESKKTEIAFLSKFHHIGVGRALALLVHFSSMKDILCAPASELQKAMGQCVDRSICENLEKLFTSK